MEFNPTWRLQPSETVSMHHLHNGEPDSTLSTMPLEYEIFETQSGKKYNTVSSGYHASGFHPENE
jgi:hypothetical protein